MLVDFVDLSVSLKGGDRATGGSWTCCLSKFTAKKKSKGDTEGIKDRDMGCCFFWGGLTWTWSSLPEGSVISPVPTL